MRAVSFYNLGRNLDLLQLISKEGPNGGRLSLVEGWWVLWIFPLRMVVLFFFSYNHVSFGVRVVSMLKSFLYG